MGEDLAGAVVPQGDTPRFRTSTPKRLAYASAWSAHPRRSLATDPHQEQPQGQVHAPTCVGQNRGRLFVGDDILGGQEWMDGPTTPCSSLQHRFVHVARGGMDLRGGASPQGPHAFNACHAYMQPPCMSGSILQGGGVSSVPASCKAALPRQKKLSPTATASDSSRTSRHCTLPPSMAWPCHGLHASVAHPGGSVGHGGHARSPPRVLWGPSAVGPVVIAVTAAGTGMNCDHTPLPQTLAPRHVCGLSVLLGGSPSTGLGHYKPTNPCPRPSLALP